MSNILEEVALIVTTIWWLQDVGRAAQKFDMQRFYHKKLNDAQVKEQCEVKHRTHFWKFGW